MNALTLKGLIREFPDFTLGPLDLVLPSGCIMGLIGENGAGKSTTIRLILNMLRPTAGEIEVLGRDNRQDFEAMKEDLGVVLDEFGCPPKMNAGQLNRVLKYTYARWDETRYLALLKDFDLPRDKEFKDYSRGMKMKLSIAAALSHRAKLLILDEATGGLDPVARDEITDLFLEFAREEDHSILISSHIVSDLEKLCDYIAFLHQGKLLLMDEKDRLLERYAMLHCPKERLAELEPGAVCGVKETPYGVSAVVIREKVPAGAQLAPIGIEDLFVYMVKGGAAE